MDLDDQVFLENMAIAASDDPCHLPRADLLRLLAMAGFGPDTKIWQDMNAMGDPVTAERDGILTAIGWARGEGGLGHAPYGDTETLLLP